MTEPVNPGTVRKRRKHAPVAKLGSKGRLGKLPQAQAESRYAFAFPFYKRLEQAMCQVLGTTLTGQVSCFMQPDFQFGTDTEQVRRDLLQPAGDTVCYRRLRRSHIHKWKPNVVQVTVNFLYRKDWLKSLELMVYVCGGRCRLGSKIVTRWAGTRHPKALRLLMLQPKPPIAAFLTLIDNISEPQIWYRCLALRSMRDRRTGAPLMSVMREVVPWQFRKVPRPAYTTALQLLLAWYIGHWRRDYRMTDECIHVAAEEGHIDSKTCAKLSKCLDDPDKLLQLAGDTSLVKPGYDQDGYPWLTLAERKRFSWPPICP